MKRGVTKRKDGYWVQLQNSLTGPFKTRSAANKALKRCLRIQQSRNSRKVDQGIACAVAGFHGREGTSPMKPSLSLFKIQLIDPVPKHGAYPQTTYVMLAADADSAVNTLREEAPFAFVYNPAVRVEPWPGKGVKLFAGRVKLSKAEVHQLFQGSTISKENTR